MGWSATRTSTAAERVSEQIREIVPGYLLQALSGEVRICVEEPLMKDSVPGCVRKVSEARKSRKTGT